MLDARRNGLSAPLFGGAILIVPRDLAAGGLTASVAVKITASQ
jgi:hypothetical protein